jgi:hypothetical protein
MVDPDARQWRRKGLRAGDVILMGMSVDGHLQQFAYMSGQRTSGVSVHFSLLSLSLLNASLCGFALHACPLPHAAAYSLSKVKNVTRSPTL